MKHKLILLGVVATIVFVTLNLSKIEVVFIKLFKITTRTIRYDKNGQADVVFYKSGLIEREAKFTGDKKAGWGITYYKNGNVKNKTFYKNDVEFGPDSQYYENGKLNYSGSFNNGTRSGAMKWYSENGRLESYAVFNLKGKSFCLFQYECDGKIKKSAGWLASAIYSVKKDGSIQVTKYKHAYNNLKDLYIIVATPPRTKPHLYVSVNGRAFENKTIKENLIILKDVFNGKGLYTISIDYSLTYGSDKKIDSVNFQHILSID